MTTQPTRITSAPLYQWLKENGVTDEQMEAIEENLYIDGDTGPMAEGAMILLPNSVVYDALEAIDQYPWKDTSPVEFRKYMQAELLKANKTGISHWYTGATTLEVQGT